MNARKLHNDKFDSKEAAKVDPDVSLKASIIPDNAIIDLRSLVCDYCYFKGLQSTAVLELHVEPKVSFPAYLNVFSKVTTQTSLRLLKAYPPAADMPAAPRDELVEIIRSTTRFGETYAFARYNAVYTATKDVVALGRAPPSNTPRIRLYVEMYREYQAHLDSILEELHQVVGKLEGTPDYDRISFIQTLHGTNSLNVVVLITEMGSFDLFPSPKKLYAYFGPDPGVNDPGKFYGDRVHMFKRGSSPVRRILHMAAINSLKMDRVTKAPVNPVIYDYYTRKCASKKKSVAVGAVMHKIRNIVFTTLRDNRPSGLITPEEHRERYAAEHLEFVGTAAWWRFELDFKIPW